MKYWEIIADNLSKAGLELGLRLSDWCQQANDLDCWRTSRQRKAFRCASGWKADCISGTRIGDSRLPRLCLTSRRDYLKTPPR